MPTAADRRDGREGTSWSSLRVRRQTRWDSRAVYEGRFTTTETVKEYHREQTVKTETDYDIYGRKTITNYVRPGYWTSKVVSKTVDVYSHYKRCYNCRHEYIFATEEKEV